MRAAAVMGIEEAAANCLDEGCSIDAVGDLLNDLKAESKALSERHQVLAPPRRRRAAARVAERVRYSALVRHRRSSCSSAGSRR